MSGAHPDSPVDLTTALQQVEASVKKLLAAGITRRAVLVLLADDTGLSSKTINEVLNAVTNLSKWTEKPK
ncbi:MAG: hypothetical protein Q8K32_09235 [Archangium sp.]|nr:hypothetical protein [Archangium sp.]